MRGLVDYHTHSILSDGSSSYEEMVLSAVEKGLEEIGFSDHICLKPVTWAMEEVDRPVMIRQINEVQEKYGHLINIRFGIELDFSLHQSYPFRNIDNNFYIRFADTDSIFGSF